MLNYNWDDNESPLAYLITIRTYGTWLQGDERWSVDRRGQNIFHTPKVKPVPKLHKTMQKYLSDEPFLLDAEHRGHVESAIKNVCQFRGYGLTAVNVRTNHGHVVVSSANRPERVATEFKSYSTRRLREAGLIGAERRVWSRGESTRYLWKERSVEAAIEYVLYGQGDELPKF
jgi:REP element-mobilizing transposase RayT